jgi:hypothetical protein
MAGRVSLVLGKPFAATIIVGTVVTRSNSKIRGMAKAR